MLSTRNVRIPKRRHFHNCFAGRITVFFLAASLLAAPAILAASRAWIIRVEEPTGLYPRTNELVSVPFSKIGGAAACWTVIDSDGRELPWQTTHDGLIFPATLIPGELPEYRVCPAPEAQSNFVNQIQFRRLGLNRVELGNSFFRIQVDLQEAAIVEAFNLTADAHRVLNLVETTPEEPEALKDDIHAAEAMGFKPVPGVPAGNLGWTSLGGGGPITNVEVLEHGPLHGVVRFARTNEIWEFTWSAESRALTWHAARGFRFTAISASPYLPFDRCVNGSEYEWPNGPDDTEPPDHDIAPRPWPKLPGNHAVYYHHAENYGALGLVALDTNLTWTGFGSRRFIAQGSGGPTAVAVTFPQWNGSNTVLQARREFRVLTQPLLIDVHESAAAMPRPRTEAARQVSTQLRMVTNPPPPLKRNAQSLNGSWELAWCEKGQGPPTNGWRVVSVPGSAHVQWLPKDQIYNPTAEWISSKEWWYRRNFDLAENLRDRSLRLQFDATDYYADTWLNGTSLGRHEGYIDPYEYDVTRLVNSNSPNTLLVRTWAPVNYYWKHRSYTVKGAYGAVDQKPDDITPLGITRSVRILGCEKLTLRDVAVDTRLEDDGSATVAIDIELDRRPPDPASLEVTLSPRNFSSDTIYQASMVTSGRTVRILIPVAHPQLWWTWDHGRPNLYTLDIRLRNQAGQMLDGQSIPLGIREIERIGWTFYLNRRRLFIRGTNYYYNLYLSEMNRGSYERDVGLMLGMNVNFIRLHCHFDNPEFYDVADESGVLIWQDYLEAWYPEDRAFSLRAAKLYDPLIRYVRNHPCIASWTTSDEESLENYRDLTKHLAPRPALLDPQRRPIVRSTGRFGDAHVYHGWYDGSIWEYTNMTEPFVSELGATCLPNFSTLIKFMPDAWPIRSHEQEWFFRRLQIPEAMKAWGDPGDSTLQEYIPKTQSYVARLFQIALERSRRLKYNPAGGICHFHAIDIWPSVTMAAIDFERTPTKVFYTVQRSFAPVCASLEYDRDAWKSGERFQCGIWAINDRWEVVPDATVRWRILDASHQENASGQFPANMPADSAFKIGTANWVASGLGPHELRAEVRDQRGQVLSENVFEFSVGL